MVQRCYIYLVLLAFLLAAAPLCAQNWMEGPQIHFLSSTQQIHLGQYFDAHEGTLVVGSPFDNTDASGANPISAAGAAYVYALDSSMGWQFVQKLVASDRAMGDRFGLAVSVHGDRLVVGAPEQTYISPNNTWAYNGGAAYVFEKNAQGNWLEVQKIIASDHLSGAHFGAPIDLYNNALAIGAQGYDLPPAPADGGAAYIFELDTQGVWQEQNTLIDPTPEPGNAFPSDISIDGDWMAIGTATNGYNALGTGYMSDAGAVYLHQRLPLGGWALQQKIVPSDRWHGDEFGFAVALEGNQLCVGAPKVETIVAQGNDVGAAYFFQHSNASGWVEEAKVFPPDLDWNDHFGHSVSLSGQQAVIGAPPHDLDTRGGNLVQEAGAS